MARTPALVGVAVASLAALVWIVAIATPGWYKIEYNLGSGDVVTSTGLFQRCSSGDAIGGTTCATTLYPDELFITPACPGETSPTYGDLNSMLQAAQAFGILGSLSALMCAPATASQLTYRYPIVALVATFFAVSTVGSGAIVFGTFYRSIFACGKTPCEMIKPSLDSLGTPYTLSCGFSYSFGLCIVAVVASLGLVPLTASLFRRPTQDSVVNGNTQIQDNYKPLEA